MKSVPIYTKTGDGGKTRTFYGEISKADDLAEALGSVDELNSWVGFVRGQINNLQCTIYNEFSKSKFSTKKLDYELRRIQNNLLVIGTILAGGPPSPRLRKDLDVKRLEKLIDKLTGELPPLKNFIYPVGEIQVARAVCRRAERRVVSLQNSKSEIRSSKQIINIIKYLNRLSDALFTLARWVNIKQGTKEEIWK